jgi:hypothetical protein
VGQGGFGMFHESLGIACFALTDGGHGVFHGLWKVNRFGESKASGQQDGTG